LRFEVNRSMALTDARHDKKLLNNQWMSQKRLSRYFTLQRHLAGLSSQHLMQSLAQSDYTQGWGVNQVLNLAEAPIFVKRIPLTALEAEQAFDTSNLFNLPMYYHYGIGSAGFGAFRELLVHIKTTTWVLESACPAFPLLYHYRIVPAQAPWKKLSAAARARHLQFWNNSPEIAVFLQARETAPFEIVLFLEYFPETLQTHLSRESRQCAAFLRQAEAGLQFLNQQGVLHLDAHLANILTDGERVVLSDFGLALDLTFALAPEEKDFWQAHVGYDQAELVSCLGFLLRQACEALPDAADLNTALDISSDRPFVERLERLLDALISPTPHAALQALPAELTTLACRHRDSVLRNAAFFEALHAKPSKDLVWPAHQTLPV